MSCRRVASDRWRLAAVVMLLSSSTHTAFGAPPPPPLTAEQTTDSVAFLELDGNEDGFLSGKEAVSVLDYDTNGDKRVTKAEFLAARELARGVDPAIEDGKQFLQLDGNEDGWLSGKEMKGLERFDANSDGEVTEKEFLAGRAADRDEKPAAKPLPSKPASLNSFLTAVAQRNAKSLLSQMHPVLRDQVDEPVLQFFVDTIHTELGAMSDDEPSDVKQDKQEADGSPIITTTATIDFAHGQANCELVIQEKAITGFSINSDKLTELDQKLGERLVKDDQFAKQVGQFYAPRGESMLTLIFQGKGEQVHAMLHPEVQQQLSLEAINAECQTARNLSGALKNIEYDGCTEVFDADTGSFKKITVNYKLECENGHNDAKVVIQFVGLSGALVGFEVNKLTDATPSPAVAENMKIYRNQLANLSEKHAGKFVPFAFTYPAAWTIDSEAGTEESSNVVKVMRNADLGDGLTFTQENFAVGSCQVSGTGELAKPGLRYLSEYFQQVIAKTFPEYKLNRNGDMQFGEYLGYGFDFTSKLPHPKKGKVDCWGRVILLAPSVIGQEHGLTVIMAATSEAPELTSLADLGIKGELPVIIRSFKVGDAAEVPEPAPLEAPFSSPKATPTPTTPPPAPPRP
jgi:hypothetical protein